MNNYKISILFLLNKVKINKRGLCPIRCRVTYQKKRKIFSTGLFINPDHWNNGVQIAEPSTPENNIINTQLSLISQKISEAFLLLQVQPDTFNAYQIGFSFADKARLLGKKISEDIEVPFYIPPVDPQLRNISSTCLRYYESRELDSIAREEYFYAFKKKYDRKTW